MPGPASDAFSINATDSYVIREAVPDQLYRVEANPDDRLGTPAFDHMRAVAITDPGTTALALEAGEDEMVVS